MGKRKRQQRARSGRSRHGTCAVCVEEREVTPTRLDEHGPEYLICESCNSDAIPDPPKQPHKPRVVRNAEEMR